MTIPEPAQSSPKSDPALLNAFRKQCQHFGAAPTLLAWQGQEGVNPDDLIDIAKEIDPTLS